MDTFEIRDEDINVEKIMEKIRENIKKRKEEGVYAENEPEIMGKTFSADSSTIKDIPEGLEFMGSCNICNESYTISSHRPVVGKFLVKGRKMVHGETRRYVDPVFQKQREFNFNVAGVIKHLKTDVDYLKTDTVKHLSTDLDSLKTDHILFDNKISNLISEAEKSNSEIKNLEMEIEYLKSILADAKTDVLQSIRNEVNNVISNINLDLDNKGWLNSVLENRLTENMQKFEVKIPEANESEINYYVFEERFRGSRDNIQQHQQVFLDYFKGCKNVLDIGCGRGEFIELALMNDIVVKGIDIDEDMINYCKSKGFNVELIDAIDALESMEDKSLDGIFVSQVVEHLAPDYLIKMLNLCNKKLKYGFYLIVETVNPLSLFSFANFYIDLTHIKPVHPETLKFLLSSVDFREIDTKFISPVPESMRLKKLPDSGELNGREKMMFETYNHNIDMLNTILYGAQDYVVIGKK